MTERYEKVRADWLLAHEAEWHLSDRRMANQLKRRAAEKERSTAGAAESSFHEGKIKPIHARFIAGGEDATEKMLRAVFLVVFLIPGVAVVLGPALALSHAAYALITESALKRGSVPTRKWWLVAAGVLAVLGPLVALVFPSAATVATVRVYPDWIVAPNWLGVSLISIWWYLTTGLALTAWQIRRHGWPGVKVRSAAKAPSMPTVPTGEQEPAPKEKAGKKTKKQRPEPEDADEAAPEAPKAPAIPAAPALPSLPEPDDEDDEDFDEEPEFDDEPEFEEHHDVPRAG